MHQEAWDEQSSGCARCHQRLETSAPLGGTPSAPRTYDQGILFLVSGFGPLVQVPRSPWPSALAVQLGVPAAQREGQGVSSGFLVSRQPLEGRAPVTVEGSVGPGRGLSSVWCGAAVHLQDPASAGGGTGFVGPWDAWVTPGRGDRGQPRARVTLSLGLVGGKFLPRLPPPLATCRPFSPVICSLFLKVTFVMALILLVTVV